MKALKQSRLAIMATMTLVLAMPVAAQNAVQSVAANEAAKTEFSAVTGKRVIVVSLEDRKLALVEDGKVVKTYPVAVGKPSTPSPVGTFTIQRRVMNPTYSHDGRIVLPGPNNPVGSRWMGLSIHGYGIHGTNVPSSIGKAASHGCIRMAKADLEELYPMVAEGDTVELIGERNLETAQLFGAGLVPNPAAQPAAQTDVASSAPTPAAPQANGHVATPDQSHAAAAIDLMTRASLTTVASLALAGSM
jgi:hypothetical protein